MPPLPWLARHLEPDERVRWAYAPGPRAWLGAAWIIGLLALLTFYVGIERPRWWRLLPFWPDSGDVDPLVGSVVSIAGFVVAASAILVARQFTAWAVTERRVLRVLLLGNRPAQSWSRPRVTVHKLKRGRGGSLVVLETPGGLVRATRRIKLRGVPDPDALVVALSLPVADARPGAGPPSPRA